MHHTACTRDFQYYFVLQILHNALSSTTLYYKACTMHFPGYFVLQSLHKELPNTTLYCNAWTKYFPILPCARKLAQGASQYYLVLQSLHKAVPSTTLHYKACTSTFQHYLFTTRAQTTSQSCFVLQCLRKALPNTIFLQSLQKTLPSITLYCKACTRHFPALLCTTNLAQGTSQYYFVPQRLHKVLPSTTW